jgi:predicted nucleic acid-binding protein
VVYDAGALVAADRGAQHFRALHQRWITFDVSPVVPSPVLTQVWQDGVRQARIARTLRACRVLPTSEDLAKHAGVLLGRSRTTDAVDAIVVATAIRYDAIVVTTDPDDLRHLWDAAGTGFEIGLVVP